MSDVQDGGVDQAQIEREARRQGWRPAEEFRGSQDDWVDAQEYVRRGKEIRAHVKAENERLARELAAANSQISEMKGTIEEIRAYHANMEERAIEAALKRMKQERRAAVAAGNNELAAEIDEDMQELKDAPRLAPKPVQKPEAQQGTPAQPATPPEVNEWMTANKSWYNNDEENEDLVAFANGVAGSVMNKNIPVADKLAEIDRRVRAQFPDRFGGGASRRSAPTAGTGEGGGSTRRTNSSVGALPDDAKQAGARFVKQGLYKDMEEYAKEYWAQPGAQAR